jgi:5-methyltetrahydrofolate--homocysteine methyltransferase
MRKALDSHTKAARPTIETIVERIGPMRNKQATANTVETSEARRERRRSRG